MFDFSFSFLVKSYCKNKCTYCRNFDAAGKCGRVDKCLNPLINEKLRNVKLQELNNSLKRISYYKYDKLNTTKKTNKPYL